MESLADILHRIAANVSSESARRGVTLDPAGETEASRCPLCGGAGWVRHRASLGDPGFGEVYPCACLMQRNQGKMRSRLERYSNLGALSDISFQLLHERSQPETAGRRPLWERALQAAEEYAAAPDGWLVLGGPSGSGKTSLAAAVANACVQRGQPALFVAVPDLLDHLRSAYAPDSPMSYDQLFEQVRNSPLLALDGLGAQNTTPWAQEKLLQVLNHRFNGKLPTVITLQCPLEDLEPGLRTRLQTQPFSRLYELGARDVRDAPLWDVLGGLGDRMMDDMTFEKFDVREGTSAATAKQTLSLKTAYEAAHNFAMHPEGWLVFSGNVGCGKTHLSVAVMNEWLNEGQRCLFAVMPALLDFLRSTFDPEIPIRYHEEFERVKEVPLLVLDDLVAETSTRWAEEKLFQIMDYRYNTQLPTVINCLTLKGMEETRPRLASRLKSNRVICVEIEAPDYRAQGNQSTEHSSVNSPPKPAKRGGR